MYSVIIVVSDVKISAVALGDAARVVQLTILETVPTKGLNCLSPVLKHLNAVILEITHINAPVVTHANAQGVL